VSILLMSQALGQAREIARLNASQEAETFPEQVTELEQAMEVEPNNFETAALLGEVHRRRAGDAGAAVRRVELKKAAGWLNRAIALNPYDAYSHARLGMTLAQLGQAEKAGPYFAQAEKLDPNGYLTVANVGWHKMHIGEYGAAKRYFERVSPLDDPTKGLIAHRSEPIAQDLARHIRESYLPYINEQLANPE
jgi:tetratricopeptide (TPR) repeat protein